jgi:hypothetical protein
MCHEYNVQDICFSLFIWLAQARILGIYQVVGHLHYPSGK